MDNKYKKKFKGISGDFDPTTPPPKIEPVPEGIKSPTWSVMIPVYNCAKFLEKALESVLEQDPGPEHMQIEVIDDCSTKDDPEAVVQKIGRGRVKYYKNAKNSGYCTKNFNICIHRSFGKLIHILHGDDVIFDGFYEEISRLHSNNPDAGFFATRSFFLNEEGIITGVSGICHSFKTLSKNISEFISEPAVQCAGVVLKREVYEKNGGFNEALKHCADWEMWIRAIKNEGGIVSKKVLAGYRMFEGNDTSLLAKTGENLTDIARMIALLSTTQSEDEIRMRIANLNYRALQQFKMFSHKKNKKAANAAKKTFRDTKEPFKNKLYRWLLKLGKALQK